MLFFRKSEVEKRAEKGDRSAILELLRKGERKKAKKLLEEHKEDPDLRKVLFDLYVEEEYYMQAAELLEQFGADLGTAETRALVYEKSGNYEKAVEEHLRVGNFESLYRAGEILSRIGKKESALEILERASRIAPPSKRAELESRIFDVKRDLGLIEEERESFLEKLTRRVTGKGRCRGKDRCIPCGRSQENSAPQKDKNLGGAEGAHQGKGKGASQRMRGEACGYPLSGS